MHCSEFHKLRREELRLLPGSEVSAGPISLNSSRHRCHCCFVCKCRMEPKRGCVGPPAPPDALESAFSARAAISATSTLRHSPIVLASDTCDDQLRHKQLWAASCTEARNWRHSPHRFELAGSSGGWRSVQRIGRTDHLAPRGPFFLRQEPQVCRWQRVSPTPSGHRSPDRGIPVRIRVDIPGTTTQ